MSSKEFWLLPDEGSMVVYNQKPTFKRRKSVGYGCIGVAPHPRWPINTVINLCRSSMRRYFGIKGRLNHPIKVRITIEEID